MSRGVKKASKKRSRSARVNFRPVKRDIPVFDRGQSSRYRDVGPDPDDLLESPFEEFAREKALYGSD